jgi:hypothetical protein
MCIYMRMCVCARARARNWFVYLTDLLPLEVEIFGLLSSSDKQNNISVHVAYRRNMVNIIREDFHLESPMERD